MVSFPSSAGRCCALALAVSRGRRFRRATPWGGPGCPAELRARRVCRSTRRLRAPPNGQDSISHSFCRFHSGAGRVNIRQVMKVLEVVVIEDHPLMREAVRAMLGCAADIRVVGDADSAERGLEVVAKTRPDVVLLDLGLPRMGGLVCLDRLRVDHPQVCVVVLSAEDDRHTIEVALRRGARAFVRKSVNPEDLPGVVRQVADETVFHATPLAVGGPGSAAKAAGLSPKELAVLEQITHGRSNKQISEALWITPDTVKFHLRHIYKKLGVASRTEALRAAHEQALFVSAPAA